MARLDVLMIGNPRLRKKSLKAKKGKELNAIISDLHDTLIHLQKTKRIGRALSVPQIGYQKKVVYFNLPGRSFAMVNPDIVWKSRELFSVWDSCFSFDVSFFVKIERHRKVKVRYEDAEGNSYLEDFEGDMSELVQHEVDHLHGILATDRLRPPFPIIMREEWEKRYR